VTSSLRHFSFSVFYHGKGHLIFTFLLLLLLLLLSSFPPPPWSLPSSSHPPLCLPSPVLHPLSSHLPSSVSPPVAILCLLQLLLYLLCFLHHLHFLLSLSLSLHPLPPPMPSPPPPPFPHPPSIISVFFGLVDRSLQSVSPSFLFISCPSFLSVCLLLFRHEQCLSK
jgi:hypothetical protein